MSTNRASCVQRSSRGASIGQDFEMISTEESRASRGAVSPFTETDPSEKQGKQSNHATQCPNVENLAIHLVQLQHVLAMCLSNWESRSNSASLPDREELESLQVSCDEVICSLHSVENSQKRKYQQSDNDISKELRKVKQELETTKAELVRSKAELHEVRNENQLMRTQTAIHREDFEQERRDRERCHTRMLEAEAERDILRKQVQRHEIQKLNSLSQRRAAALAYHRAEYERNHPYFTTTDGKDDHDEEGLDELDFGMGPSLPVTPKNDFSNELETSFGYLCKGKVQRLHSLQSDSSSTDYLDEDCVDY